MSARIRLLIVTAVAAAAMALVPVAVSASPGGPGNPNAPGGAGGASAADDGCQDADDDLTAKYVNTSVIGDVVEVGECDVGVYFDEAAPANARVQGATIVGNPDYADDQIGVLAHGASVRVANSTFEMLPDTAGSYPRQYVHINLRAGADGHVVGNDLKGNHRVGIVARGAGTTATIRGNSVNGSGAINEGWAENGIQVSYGATGTVMANEVRDHWWGGGDVSSGILIFESDGVMVRGNELAGNEASIAAESWGGFDAPGENSASGNQIVGNTIDVAKGGADGISVLAFPVFGDAHVDNNRVINNTIRGDDIGEPYAGVFVGAFDLGEGVVTAENNKVINNTISGFDQDVGLEGDDATKVRANRSPAE